jgi:hypothetical protein
MTDADEPRTLAQLIEVLAALPGLEPVARCKRARALDTVARRILADVGNEATTQLATEQETDGTGRRVRTYAETGRLLGVSPYRVSNAIGDYRRRHGGQ